MAFGDVTIEAATHAVVNAHADVVLCAAGCIARLSQSTALTPRRGRFILLSVHRTAGALFACLERATRMDMLIIFL